MGQSSNLLKIIIITVMQLLSRAACDCPVNETLHILRDNPVLEKYRSICDHLRNVTFLTLDKTAYIKSEAFCVKEFERHYSDLMDFINIRCSHYSMGTTYPSVASSETSKVSPYITLSMDETDNSTTKSTTIVYNLTTGNESDVSAGTKEYLLTTSTTAFADDHTTVIREFTIGNKSDISESTMRPSPSSSPMSTFAYNHTVESTTDTGDFTTGNENDISDSTKRLLLSTLTTEFADILTTVPTTVVNDFTIGNESDISDSTKGPLLSTSTTALADNRTTLPTTVVSNVTTGNESDISDSTKRPLLKVSLLTITDDHVVISTLADEDLTTDKKDVSDGTEVPLLDPITITRSSTYVNFSELNKTIIPTKISTSRVMTIIGGKEIETTTAKVVKSRTRTTEMKTPKKAGISTLYALLLLFTALTLGIIVIITVLIVYKKFRTGSYEPEAAGLRDTSLELEDSL